MKTKFCVFNDRTKPMALQVQSTPSEAEGLDHLYFTVKPQTSMVVDLDIPEGTIPFLKIWESGQALLSYIGPANLPQSEA